MVNEENRDLLVEIKDILSEINSRDELNELTKESDGLKKKVDDREIHFIKQIQNSFDREHDKLFTFNSVMVAAYFVIISLPSESKIIEAWTLILPVINLGFLTYLEILQRRIYRFASNPRI